MQHQQAEEQKNLKGENSELRLRLAKAEDDRDKAVGAAERKEVALSDALLAKETEVSTIQRKLTFPAFINSF